VIASIRYHLVIILFMYQDLLRVYDTLHMICFNSIQVCALSYSVIRCGVVIYSLIMF
jgi:hypothetical protein